MCFTYAQIIYERKLKIKILQIQDEAEKTPFQFPLFIRIVSSKENNKKDPKEISIKEKITEIEIDIPNDISIKFISIDPNLNLIKEIKSVKILEEKKDFQLNDMLLNQ